MPPLAQIDFAGPRRIACDSTYRTAGPGVRLSTASVATNNSQRWKVISAGFGVGLWASGSGLQALGLQLRVLSFEPRIQGSTEAKSKAEAETQSPKPEARSPKPDLLTPFPFPTDRAGERFPPTCGFYRRPLAK